MDDTSADWQDPDKVRAALDTAEENFNLEHIKMLRARLFELEDEAGRDDEDDSLRGFRAMYFAIKI